VVREKKQWYRSYPSPSEEETMGSYMEYKLSDYKVSVPSGFNSRNSSETLYKSVMQEYYSDVGRGLDKAILASREVVRSKHDGRNDNDTDFFLSLNPLDIDK